NVCATFPICILDLQKILGAIRITSTSPFVSCMWPRKAFRESHDKNKGKEDCKGANISRLPTKGPMEISNKKTKVIIPKDLVVLKWT
uniref:Uncharacterized protein n=1 Tax=Suricata suricatta TaxID=37032 RepID=A0A673TD66_SURSU